MRFVSYLCTGLLLAAAATPGLATTRPPKVQSESEDGGERLEYQRALARLESLRERGLELNPIRFQRLNWVGKTAAINYACSALPLGVCRNLLETGISDRALVVRDHALKVILASETYIPQEKKLYAQKMIDDTRNYRGGVALWIVDRAKNFLKVPKD